MTDDKDNTTAELQDQFDDDIHIEHLKYVEQRCMEFGMWGPPMMMVHSALKLAQDELESGARETIDKLTAEKRALEAELRMARGEVKTVLNNTETARQKAERAAADYRRWMEQPRDESWERELKLAKSTGDFWKEQYDKAMKKLANVRKIASSDKPYTLVEEEL